MRRLRTKSSVNFSSSVPIKTAGRSGAPKSDPAGANLTPRAAAGSGRIKEKCSIGAAEHLEAGDVNEAILGFSVFLVQDREPDRVLAGLEASVRPIKGQVAPRAELVHHVDRLVVDRH